MKIRLAGVIKDSIVDGPGLRTVIFTQGCYHNCDECHNKHTHDIHGGYLKEINELAYEIVNARLQRGITISGGEPFLQAKEINYLITKVKELNNKYDIWIYTGYLIEELLDKSNPNLKINLEILTKADTLVDGRFNKHLKDINLVFKGSSNQRIINLNEYFNNYKSL